VEILNLEAEMVSIYSEIQKLTNYLNANVSYILTSNATVAEKLAELHADVATLQTSISNEIQRLDSVIADLTSNITAVQNALSDLTDHVTTLNQTLNQIEGRTWQLIHNMSGSGDAVGSSFTLQGVNVRILYTMYGNTADAWLQIGLHYSSGTLFTYRGGSGVYTSDSTDTQLFAAGSYYLNVTAYNIDAWYIYVYNYN
jgi:prefoldin subunit 5